MMDMMNSASPTGGGMGDGFAALWAIHILSVIIFFVGVLLIILWAAKTLSQSQLKTWGIVLAVIGTIACLLTIGARGGPWIGGGMMEGRGMKMMRMPMMQNGMMDDDEDDAGMMYMGMMDDEDMMEMSMDDMASMLEGKTGDAFDEAFLEGMIPHHQGAIDMAEAALKNAKHDEIRAMARAIISAQQQEIDQMREWQKSWGYSE